jgi:hypothetical protein
VPQLRLFASRVSIARTPHAYTQGRHGLVRGVRLGFDEGACQQVGEHGRGARL